MKSMDSAREILEVLKEERNFTCLRDLAKKAGFSSAANASFKRGLNFLRKKEVIKIQQSGWSSEKRGGRRHPKGVILLGNIFTLEEDLLNWEIDDIIYGKKTGPPPKRVKPSTSFKGINNSELNQLLKEWKGCSKCVNQPFVFITDKQIPLCLEHWKQLAPRNINWHA